MLPLVDIRDGELSFTIRGKVVEHLAAPESVSNLADIFSRRCLHAPIEVRDGRKERKLSFRAHVPCSLQTELLGELEAWYYAHSGEKRPEAEAA